MMTSLQGYQLIYLFCELSHLSLWSRTLWRLKWMLIFTQHLM